ncbi:MAG: hypothetical protein OIN84_10925 [Candidatus Methanoperedens sp.]|nr:hypothetical protein [Candidatus Methanoperedens sp.]
MGGHARNRKKMKERKTHAKGHSVNENATLSFHLKKREKLSRAW